jgi:hypothetical protein
VLCGAPSETALTEALGALCAGDAAATRCDLTLVVDPEGNERSIEGVSFVGPAAQPLPEAPGEADPPGASSEGEPLPEAPGEADPLGASSEGEALPAASAPGLY